MFILLEQAEMECEDLTRGLRFVFSYNAVSYYQIYAPPLARIILLHAEIPLSCNRYNSWKIKDMYQGKTLQTNKIKTDFSNSRLTYFPFNLKNYLFYRPWDEFETWHSYYSGLVESYLEKRWLILNLFRSRLCYNQPNLLISDIVVQCSELRQKMISCRREFPGDTTWHRDHQSLVSFCWFLRVFAHHWR